MNPEELDRAIAWIGLNHSSFARRLPVHVRSVQRWCNGKRSIPPPLVALMELLIENRAARKWFVARDPNASPSVARGIPSPPPPG